MLRLLLIISTLWFVQVEAAVVSLKEQAQKIDQILEDRLDNLLPELMQRQNIDMWLLISREYNEDPILKTMLPSSWESARRTTILLIYKDKDNAYQRLSVSRYAVGNLFKQAWDKEQQPNQWLALADLIKQIDPDNIAINHSQHFALADGLVHSEYQKLMSVLPQGLQARVISSEPLAIAWLETRTPLEMEIYPQITDLGHGLIKRAFSNEVVTPGKTTLGDVAWWLREQTTSLGLSNWFHPTVSIQRQQDKTKFDQIAAFSGYDQSLIIEPGDLLHVDFGITYLRLNTDQQQHAYVLKPGETQAPQQLQLALQKANQLQDILLSHIKLSKTGNEVLALARQQAIESGLKPTIYTHPIGFHGHAAGATIGMWDQQQGVAVNGDYPIQPNTAYSIELNNADFIQSWNKEIRIMLEEEAFFDGNQIKYLSGRQQQFHLIKSL